MTKVQDNTQETTPEETQAKAIARILDDHAQNLSAVTLKRLEESRTRAVNVHSALTTGGTIDRDGTLSWFSLGLRQHPGLVGAGLLCAALVVGITLTQNNYQQNEQGDAFLLASDLPPEAFVDKGFEPWLNAKAEL